MKWSTPLMLALVLLVAWPLSAGQRRSRWWQSEEVKSEIHLTDEQSAQIEQTYQAAQPKLRRAMRKLGHEETALSRLIEEMRVGEAEIVVQIERVEAARSELSKARILMIYRMHQVLQKKQDEALRNLWDRERARERRTTGQRPDRAR